jgi:hypothetical protein
MHYFVVLQTVQKLEKKAKTGNDWFKIFKSNLKFRKIGECAKRVEQGSCLIVHHIIERFGFIWPKNIFDPLPLPPLFFEPLPFLIADPERV